jgi:ankyrin repeat protein
MRLLLDSGADPALTTRNQTTAVMFAAGPSGGGLGGSFPVADADRIEAMTLALDRGVDVNAVDSTGQTALHIAAGQSSMLIVAALIRRGANLALKDKQGRTPLDVALGVGGRGGQPVVRAEIAEVLRRFANDTAAATIQQAR